MRHAISTKAGPSIPVLPHRLPSRRQSSTLGLRSEPQSGSFRCCTNFAPDESLFPFATPASFAPLFQPGAGRNPAHHTSLRSNPARRDSLDDGRLLWRPADRRTRTNPCGWGGSDGFHSSFQKCTLAVRPTAPAKRGLFEICHPSGMAARNLTLQGEERERGVRAGGSTRAERVVVERRFGRNRIARRLASGVW